MTKLSKKRPAKKAEPRTNAHTRAPAREAGSAKKLTRAEKKAANQAAHAVKQAAAAAERAARKEAEQADRSFNRRKAPVEPPSGPEPEHEQAAQPEPPASKPEPERDERPILAPTRDKYRPEYCQIAKTMTVMGATRADLARAFDVSEESIRQWRLRHDEFAAALKAGDEAVVANCENSLYELAVGYSHEVTKVLGGADGPVRVRYTEAYPPSLPAIAKVLNNRAPHRWRPDNAKLELTGAHGTPLIPPEDKGDRQLELARKVGFMFAAALDRAKKAGLQTDGQSIYATAKDITPAPSKAAPTGPLRNSPSLEEMMAAAVDRLKAQFPPEEPGDAK